MAEVRPRLQPVVADLRRRVREALQDLGAGDLVLVACSGGPDSLALAAATAFEATRAGHRAGAVTVDHGLQADSARVCQAVESTLRGLGLDPVKVLRVHVPMSAGGPEAAARDARYAALDQAASQLGAGAVLLGHTLDDQAETVLLGLARGSGARSLSGMRPVTGIYRRPLLGATRQSTAAACRVLGLRPWLDPHNEDLAYLRVRVRTVVLPVLESELGPGVAAALARTADLLAADADALDTWADLAFTECALTGGLAVGSLRSLPVAVRSRVLRSAALAAGCPAGDLTAGHIGAIDRLVLGRNARRQTDLPGKVRAERQRDSVVFAVNPVAGSEPIAAT